MATMTLEPTLSSAAEAAQAARTRFVVGGMALMFVVSWTMSLGPLIGTKFWDQKYNLEQVHYHDPMATSREGDPSMYNSTAMEDVETSYFTRRRHLYFLPHVFGAIFWWNLYFLQLIPQIRHNYKKFHRYLGRCLMVVVLLQTTSGIGLAITSHSSVVKLVTITLAIAAYYCIYYAYKYAYYRDIPMHKYWVYRLVGYMQTIALQRFWLLVLIVSHQMGFRGLYPALNNGNDASQQELANKVVYSMFDDSAVISILTAILVTEWYLAGMKDMMKVPVMTAAYLTMTSEAVVAAADVESEKSPLLA